jgi:prepilin-type processing-associated H-X9-DG protein
MRKICLSELLVLVGVVVVLAILILSALARPVGPRRCHSCQNNLKQMGLVFKMYANESKGQFPPVSPVSGNWMVSMAAVYPEYLTDLTVLICPNSPNNHPGVFTLKDNREHSGAKIGAFHPDCATSLFYVYTGYELLRDEEAWALSYARATMPEGWLGRVDINVTARQGESVAPPISVPKLQDTDVNGSPRPSVPVSRVSVMWDRIGTAKGDNNHPPAGSNVLYFDGHVEFKQFTDHNKSDEFPVTRVAAELFGPIAPQPSRDCRE